MATGIEFNLNFSTNTGPIKRALGEMSSGYSAAQKTMDALQISTVKLLGLGGSLRQDMGQDWDEIFLNIRKGVDETFGTSWGRSFEDVKTGAAGVEEELTAFRNLMSKQLVEDFKTSSDTILTGINHWIEGFSAAEGNSEAFSKAITALQFDKGFEKDFDNLTENMSKFNEMAPNLSKKRLEPLMNLVEELSNQDAPENIAEISKNLTKLLDKTANIEAMEAAFKKLWQSTKNFFGRYVRGIAGAIGAYTVLEDAAKTHSIAAQSVARYGIGSWDGYANVIDNATDATKATGDAVGRVRDQLREFNTATIEAARGANVSLTEAAEAMQNLAQLRITDNISELGELAETTTLMSKAFGVSQGAAAQFARSLIQVGGVGADEFKKAGNALASVQAEMGLTEAATTATMNQVGIMMRQIKLFGGQSSDVSKVTREVARLASSFEKVGLSAEDANQFLSKMMDPSQINDNILLWQGLGMTAQDGMAMMMGDADQMGNMTERMRDLAVSLKEQYGGNIFALQEMSKAYGMNLQQVQALSSLTDEQMAQDKNRANLEDAALASRQGMMEQLKRLGDSLNVILQTFVLPAITILSDILEKVARGFNWINQLTGVFGTALKAIIALVAVGLLAGFLKNLSIVKQIGGAIGGAAKGMWNMAKGMGSFLKNAVKAAGGPIARIKEAFGKRAGAASRVAGPAAPAVPKVDAKAPDVVSKTGEAFKKFPEAKQLLALAVAILAIGVAVAIIVLSIAVLANVMKDMEMGQMIVFLIGIALVLGVIMWGLVAAIGAMGAISAVAAGPLMAVGLALLMMGAAVAIIILSMAVLVNSVVKLVGAFTEFFSMILNSGASFGKIVGTFAAIALGIIMLGYAFLTVVPALLVFGIVAAATAAPILALGVGLFLLGLGARMMKGLSETFSAIGPSAKVFAAALLLLAPSMLAFSGAAIPFALALAAMALGIVPMILLGIASSRLAENMMLLGTGLKMIAENTQLAMTGLANLLGFFKGDQAETMKSFSELAGPFARSLEIMAGGFLLLGFAALLATGPLLALGVVFTMIGAGAEIMGKANELFNNLGVSLSTLSASLLAFAPAMAAFSGSAIPFILALAAMAPGIIIMALLGRASGKLAENMMSLGTGLQLITENATLAMEGLTNLMSFFQEDQITALEDFATRFTKQMQKISESIIKMQVSVMIGGIAGFVGGLLGKITGEATGATPSDQDNQIGSVVEQLQISNEYLSKIKDNTFKTNELMSRLLNKNPRVEFEVRINRS